jgi:16S rRNA (cytosine967-C5)-methyltransferase
MKKNSEREVAVAALREILESRAYSNLALRRILAENGHLGRVQRAFVTEIVAGCVRNLFYIDHIIANFSKTPLKKIKPQILNILRISVYQMKFMDKVPIFAICDEAVKMAKSQAFGGLSGFVNSLLRNIARNETPAPKDLSIRYSTQNWIVRHFIDELGESGAKSLLTSIMQPPAITLCVNTLKVTTSDLAGILAAEGVEVAPATVANALKIAKTADISTLDSFKQGLYHIMDEAAMLAVQIAAPPENARIIDLCAAPGGKTFAAAYLAGVGAKIVANDIHPHKIKLLEDGVARLGLKNVEARLADAKIHRPELANWADLLIVDAPCSGLGTLRRRPDLKLFKEPESPETLALLAREFIKNSWQYVKIGGRILFCTCTISKIENIDNFNWIKANLPFKPVDFFDKIPQPLDYPTAKFGHIQILPQNFDTDGFFISLLERVE